MRGGGRKKQGVGKNQSRCGREGAETNEAEREEEEEEEGGSPLIKGRSRRRANGGSLCQRRITLLLYCVVDRHFHRLKRSR